MNRDEIIRTWETDGRYRDWYAIDSYDSMDGKTRRIFVADEDTCIEMMRNTYAMPSDHAMGNFYRCSFIPASAALAYFEGDEQELDERSAYTLTETAGILGITRQSVHGLIQRGTLDAHKVGNSWMVYRYSVENRMKQQA